MPTVQDILQTKGTDVVKIQQDACVLDAAILMDSKRIGALAVMDADRLVGIFSERDLLTRVIVAGKNPSDTPISEVMTTQVRVCELNTSLDECSTAMTCHKIRHLPVVDERGGLLGMLSTGDILARQFADQEATIRFLHEYITGPN
ncbi:MAG: CBS domain-containing protein [Planctomycetota bacterium]